MIGKNGRIDNGEHDIYIRLAEKLGVRYERKYTHVCYSLCCCRSSPVRATRFLLIDRIFVLLSDGILVLHFKYALKHKIVVGFLGFQIKNLLCGTRIVSCLLTVLYRITTNPPPPNK